MTLRCLLPMVLATFFLWPADVFAADSSEPATVTLAPGEYLWMPELAPGGPLVIVISLPQQLGFVYRNGVRIGVTTVSTGKPGFETPAGVYNILEKRREHYSNRYDNAPMPYMQRLTWDGVALHAGRIPGAPASHGCVRLPEVFASKLFELTARGMIVVIADRESPSPVLAAPGFFAPVDPTTGAPQAHRDDPAQRYYLSPELAPAGPLSLLISSADAAVVVIRNGIEIGRAHLDIAAGTHFGLHGFVMIDSNGDGSSAVVPGRIAHRWMELPMPAHDPPGHQPFDAAAVRAMNLPPDFLIAVHDWLVPGSTVIVTDEAIDPGASMTVLDAAESPAEGASPQR